jgi:GT2 family glycosyltransferase
LKHAPNLIRIYGPAAFLVVEILNQNIRHLCNAPMVKAEESLCRFDEIYQSPLQPLPKVSVVILNWNGKNYLEQFLPSVLSTTYQNKEIIVVDNHSDDDSVIFLQANYPSVRIIQHPENRGFTKGYNAALREINADYYVILNSDVEVTAGWLDPMVELLETDKTIAACQPKILAWHDRTMFEYAGAAGGWIDRYGYPFCKGRVFEAAEKDEGQYDVPESIFWASGAALFIRASAFHSQNGFDERFFAHQEEIDLCWRLQNAGYKIYSCPGSVVYHVGAGTLQKSNPKKTFLNFRNNLIMLAKNLPAGKQWVIVLRMMLDAAAAWKGLLTGNARYFLAILNAQWAFIRWKFSRGKSSSTNKRDPLTLNGVFNGNLVWQFFLKKKRTFREIVKKQ